MVETCVEVRCEDSVLPKVVKSDVALTRRAQKGATVHISQGQTGTRPGWAAGKKNVGGSQVRVHYL